MPRRPSIVLLSVTGHAIALGVLVVLSILAPDALPFPRRLLAAPTMRVVQMPDPPPSIADAAPRDPSKPGPVESAPDTVPLIQPDAIAPDTGSQLDRRLGERVNGIEREAGSVVGPGLGTTENAPLPPKVASAPRRLHSGIEAPRKLVDRAPEYPPLARATGTKGIVILEVVISEHGDVTEARILRSIALLDQAALDAVRQWKFSPARLNGQAMAVVMTVTVNFELR